MNMLVASHLYYYIDSSFINYTSALLYTCTGPESDSLMKFESALDDGNLYVIKYLVTKQHVQVNGEFLDYVFMVAWTIPRSKLQVLCCQYSSSVMNQN